MSKASSDNPHGPVSPRLSLDLACASLNSGDEGKARDLALKYKSVHYEDPEILSGWGEVCEQLGMARQAKECYERALRLDPNDALCMYKLAALLAEVGNFEGSSHYLKKALKRNPGLTAARELLAENHRALGFEGQAQALLPAAEQATEESPLRYFPPSVGERDTEKLMRLFSGRETGYAEQEICRDTARVLFPFRNGCLTSDLIASHLLGETTLAVYPLRSDNTVRFAGISVFVERSVLQSNIGNRGYLTFSKEKARRHAVLATRFASSIGIRAYSEDTGEWGYRIWFFFGEFNHFLKVKRFLDLFLEKAPPAESGVAVEPILSTRPVGLGWIERPVVLPLGIECTTLQRSLFLDSGGAPHPEQLKFLKQVREIPLKSAFEFLKASGLSPIVGKRKNSGSGAVELLGSRCAVLNELIGKAVSGRMLRREEKVVLFYTVGLLDQDGTCLHDLLGSCPDYSFDSVKNQRARLKPNPVSCFKVRELIPEITASVHCNCSFDLGGGKYPSPLLHVNAHLVPAAGEFAVPGQMRLREAAQRYVTLRRHAEEVNTALSRIESVLERHFSRRGVDRVKIEGFMVKKTVEDGRTAWILERC
ncbi:MAG: CRISPR-associated primase-polymerase type A1 [Syntrophobacteraceae bacterium]